MFSIDHKAVKGIPILVIDLNSVSQVRIFDELIRQRRLLYVHFAPPCGTASKARTIKLNLKNEPKPLRSLRFPMGLPGLKGVQLERVKLANSLYEFTAKYVQLLHERNIGWSVENPSSSLMWVTPPFANLMLSLRAEISGVLFHTCMFGAPGRSRLPFGPMSAKCCNWQDIAQMTINMHHGASAVQELLQRQKNAHTIQNCARTGQMQLRSMPPGWA